MDSTNTSLLSTVFYVPVYSVYNEANPDANVIGYTRATYLTDSSGQYVLNPKNEPYKVPVGYDPQDTVDKYSPLTCLLAKFNNILASLDPDASVEPSDPILPYLILQLGLTVSGAPNLLDYGGVSDLQRSFNGISFGGFVEAFTPIASFDFGVATRAAGLPVLVGEAGGGVLNLIRRLTNNNIKLGFLGNNPNNPPNIEKGADYYDSHPDDFTPSDPTGTCPFEPPFWELPPPPLPQGAKDVLPNAVAPSYSPLILDLDGDGVETLGVSSGVQFDLDNNGLRETVGWAGADDGLLALDRDGDGVISGGTELFGNHTVLASGNRAANGFLALAEYDANKDGRIDSGDAVFANLRVWRDINANGESDAGELLSLTEAGVSRLNLANTYSTTIDAQGNAHRQLGSYVDAAGNTRVLTDVWFDVDPTRTKTLTAVPIPEEIAALPDAQGSGNVRSLRETMALDFSGKLQELVEQFVAETDPDARRTLLPEIMFQWIGGKCAHLDDGYFADNWGNGSAGAYFRTTITQEQYSVLEAFIGTEKYFNNYGSAMILQNRYQQLEDMVFYQLMSQTHLKGVYQLVSFSRDEATGTWRGDYRLAALAITIRSMEAPEEAAGLLRDFLRSVRGMNPYITDNSAAVRREFEDIIKVGWQEPAILTLGATLSAFYLGASEKAEMLNATQLGDKYTGVMFGGEGNDAGSVHFMADACRQQAA